MTRRELEHIIRAGSANVDSRDIVVIGSQAILGTYPDPPADLIESMEADVFARDAPERSIVIDGSIGELPLFHSTFGYYAHGVDETTAILPHGWREPLVKVETPNTMGAVGWCLEAHALAVSKLGAGRGKDRAFVRTMVDCDLVSVPLLRERLAQTPGMTPDARETATGRLILWSTRAT